MHDLLGWLAMHGFERIFIVNGHGGNIATIKSAFAQAYRSVSKMDLPLANSFRCKLANWFMVPEVYAEAKSLYGEKEGQHATPSEIALTLYLEPILLKKQFALPKPAPAGPIYDYQDFRRRYPDGRMGSDPYLAKPNDGKIFLDKAASALTQDLTDFIQEQ